ncbi:6-phosphogluconolactonase [Aeromicrobium chenweiae]|uniref:6-phosphogluconolactonase n=1 Tax=Aeromicrobium chenweiae TaxID=2079793 RepID=A0A2S0WLP4_9ACTN|nr:6-phosphogluconolactonase [Aeromicrobium chenweiae]AWB92190.1 6-phosphogluconolactonase [Aeromicrobium chenweiae]TGN31525.1 6-phosphogluconolactonase [Aeromicrobium chenweiae]
MTTEVWPTAEELAAIIAERITEKIAAVQREGRTPTIVLTGGTIAIDAYEQIQDGDVDWTNVEFYWGDERFVPAGDADRNDQQAKDAFLDRLGVPAERIHAMPAQGAGLEMAEAADQYAASLPAEPFDLVLLGVGPDGHIASLFPGHPQLHETKRLAVEVFDSPKPPPERISLTYPALRNAQSVWLIVAGEGKAEAVARAHAHGTIEDTPASGVQGLTETVWLLDVAASSLIVTA